MSTLRSRINAPSPLPPRAFCFWKKNAIPSAPAIPAAVIKTPRLLIFGFSSLAPKKFEQCKTYLSIQNPIKIEQNRFFRMFSFSMLFLNELVKTKQNYLCLRVAIEH